MANLVFGLSLKYYNEVCNGSMAYNLAAYKASDHMEGKIDKNELAYFGFPVWEFASTKKDTVSLFVGSTLKKTGELSIYSSADCRQNWDARPTYGSDSFWLTC